MGVAVGRAHKVVQNLKPYGGAMRTKAPIAVGTAWKRGRPHGGYDAHGTPVHAGAGMPGHARRGTLLVDKRGGEKSPVAECPGRPNIAAQRKRC